MLQIEAQIFSRLHHLPGKNIQSFGGHFCSPQIAASCEPVCKERSYKAVITWVGHKQKAPTSYVGSIPQSVQVLRLELLHHDPVASASGSILEHVAENYLVGAPSWPSIWLKLRNESRIPNGSQFRRASSTSWTECLLKSWEMLGMGVTNFYPRCEWNCFR